MLLSGQMFDQGCYSGGNWVKHDFGGVTMYRWVGKLNMSLGFETVQSDLLRVSVGGHYRLYVITCVYVLSQLRFVTSGRTEEVDIGMDISC